MITQRLLTIGVGLFMLAPTAWAIPQVPLPVIERDPNDLSQSQGVAPEG